MLGREETGSRDGFLGMRAPMNLEIGRLWVLGFWGFGMGCGSRTKSIGKEGEHVKLWNKLREGLGGREAVKFHVGKEDRELNMVFRVKEVETRR